jgi:beta-aspartyl-peptidase (threonine type)
MSGSRERWSLVLHGGAGKIERGQLRPEQERAYRDALAAAAEAAAVVLGTGGRAIDAVTTAVRHLEDDPLFNAGRGAVFTADGRVELDAAIMDGRYLTAGAVAGVSAVKNPVMLARAVMERSPHVFLIGSAADGFARQLGFERPEPGYFFTSRRWSSLQHELQRQGLPLPALPRGAHYDALAILAHDEGKHGTVGAVARDIGGDVAAATSTGGTTAKRWGRVGDSPVIGAGTYATNRACAVSATGEGEIFIRLAAAKEVCSLFEHRQLSLQAAVDTVVHRQLSALGGDGGLIAVAPDGTMAWSFNTSGMHRARVAAGEQLVVSMYKDDP